MAKIGFTKLSLKRKNEVKTITINNNQIEIKQYLPVNEKLDLIARVINGAHDQNNFPNPIKIEVIGTLEMIMAYTNISFTEKQKEDIPKLYDLLEENGVIKDIISQIPEDEYNFIIDGINKINMIISIILLCLHTNSPNFCICICSFQFIIYFKHDKNNGFSIFFRFNMMYYSKLI